MIVVAAIRYEEEQNEPSSPFLLEVSCRACPTKEEFEAAVVAICRREKDEMIAEYEREYGEKYGDDEDTSSLMWTPKPPSSLKPVTASWETQYGDLAVDCGGGSWWFIGIQESLREKFRLPPRTY